MKKFNLKVKQLVLAFSLALLLPLAFQNCSAVDFGRDYSSESISAASIDGSSVYYTNQKIVPVTVTEGGLLRFTELRYSTSTSFDGVDWIPRDAIIYADLKDDYASDGSKDGEKNIYLELRDPLTDERKLLTVPIFLDTQVPSISGTGLLALGTRGKVFAKGERVDINWEAADRVAKSGAQSGLDPVRGLKWGVSYNGDCSENSLSQKTDWESPKSSLSVAWPEADRLKAFYFCVYVKDRAGNVANTLSQPMTNVWQVLAGDNNQGNGSSVFAKSVRFGYPMRLVMDSQANVYILDAYLNTIRKVGADNSINAIAGNGLWGNLVEGDALSSPLTISDMAFDSKDRLIILGSNAIWCLTLPTATEGAKLKKWVTSLGGGARIFVDPKTDTLFLSRYTSGTSIDNGSYIYKFALADLEAKSLPVDFSAIGPANIIAGNGKSMDASDPNALVPVLPGSSSVDFPAGLIPGDAGEVYFVVQVAGGGYPYGHNQLRMLKPDQNGVLQNYLVTTAIGGAHWLQHVHYTDESGVEQKYLIVATENGLKKVPLALPFPLKNTDIKTLDPHPASDLLHPIRVGGVLAVFDRTSAANKKLNSIIFAESSNSRITTMSASGSLISIWGRPAFDATQVGATDAIVNNPDSVVQTKNGDVYFAEPLSAMVRKVDPSGSISVVTGQFGRQVSTSTLTTVTTSFDKFTFNGLSTTYGGRFFLGYNPDTEEIVMPEGDGMVLRTLNLQTKSVSTLYAASNRSNTDADSWRLFAMAMSPDHKVVTQRVNSNYQVNGSVLRAFSWGSMSSAYDFVGNRVTGNPTVGALATETAIPSNITATAFDAAGNFYLSANGTFKVDAVTRVVSKISATSFFTMVAVETSNGPHLIGLTTDSMFDLKVPASGVVVPTQICLPGTFLNRPGHVTVGIDGNLLIADSRNDRIVKYFVRDESNGLKIYDKACSSLLAQ